MYTRSYAKRGFIPPPDYGGVLFDKPQVGNALEAADNTGVNGGNPSKSGNYNGGSVGNSTSGHGLGGINSGAPALPLEPPVYTAPDGSPLYPLTEVKKPRALRLRRGIGGKNAGGATTGGAPAGGGGLELGRLLSGLGNFGSDEMLLAALILLMLVNNSDKLSVVILASLLVI